MNANQPVSLVTVSLAKFATQMLVPSKATPGGDVADGESAQDRDHAETHRSEAESLWGRLQGQPEMAVHLRVEEAGDPVDPTCAERLDRSDPHHQMDSSGGSSRRPSLPSGSALLRHVRAGRSSTYIGGGWKPPATSASSSANVIAVSSSKSGPMICIPTGRPPAVRPTGATAAGRPGSEACVIQNG